MLSRKDLGDYLHITEIKDHKNDFVICVTSTSWNLFSGSYPDHRSSIPISCDSFRDPRCHQSEAPHHSDTMILLIFSQRACLLMTACLVIQQLSTEGTHSDNLSKTTKDSHDGSNMNVIVDADMHQTAKPARHRRESDDEDGEDGDLSSVEKRRRAFRGDLGKRFDEVEDLSSLDFDMLPTEMRKRVKASRKFRGDLGKRLRSSFRGDLGK